MSWEAVTALASLVSAIVVAVAATAAVLQIRHLRTGNQLEAILRIYETFNSAEMARARNYCIHELPRIVADDALRAEMLNGEADPRLILVGNFSNEIGALVVDGFLDERLILRLIPSIVRLWREVAPIAYEWRRLRGAPIWSDFEYLAALEPRVIGNQHVNRFPAWFRPRLLARDEPTAGYSQVVNRGRDG